MLASKRTLEQPVQVEDVGRRLFNPPCFAGGDGQLVEQRRLLPELGALGLAELGFVGDGEDRRMRVEDRQQQRRAAVPAAGDRDRRTLHAPAEQLGPEQVAPLGAGAIESSFESGDGGHR
jgi:hypothetical protein